jgi:hypothetical protein
VNSHIDPDDLRRRVAALNSADLYPTYFALGGACTAFELEAFVNAALELPGSELAALNHAVWEVAEFGPELDAQSNSDGPRATYPDRGRLAPAVDDELLEQTGTGVFVAGPAAARRARAWLAWRLDELGVCDPASLVHDDAIFVASELVTKSVLAHATTVCVTVDTTPARLLIEVADDAPFRAQLRRSVPNASSGRGLALVMALVAEWHIVSTMLGRTVSVVLDIPVADGA